MLAVSSFPPCLSAVDSISLARVVLNGYLTIETGVEKYGVAIDDTGDRFDAI